MDLIKLREIVRSVRDRVLLHRDTLTELDQQSGDGDLGVSMCSGFQAAAERLDTLNATDLGTALREASRAFNEAAPSSMGTILSIFMNGMARQLRGKETASLDEMTAALTAGTDNITRLAGSRPGEKTVLDALCPAAEALRENRYAEPAEALTKAAAAARAGYEATKGMKAVWGRAAYYGEQSVGLADGGACVGWLLFEVIAASFRQESDPDPAGHE